MAAVIATFNDARLVWELSHLHVLSIYGLPFALLGLHRYFETDARRYLVGAGAALVAVAFSSIYYLACSAPLVRSSLDSSWASDGAGECPVCGSSFGPLPPWSSL